MAQLNIFSNKFEDGISITNEDGTRVEAVVVHLPGSDEVTFHLGTYDTTQDIDASYQELYCCPVQAK